MWKKKEGEEEEESDKEVMVISAKFKNDKYGNESLLANVTKHGHLCVNVVSFQSRSRIEYSFEYKSWH